MNKAILLHIITFFMLRRFYWKVKVRVYLIKIFTHFKLPRGLEFKDLVFLSNSNPGLGDKGCQQGSRTV